MPVMLIVVFISVSVLIPIHQARAIAPVIVWGVITAGSAVAAYLSADKLKENAVEWAGNLVLAIVYILASLVLKILNYLVYWAAWAVNIFLDPDIYKEVLSSSAINTGWTICRDLCNLFFVMLLLAIAFATIFRIQAYSAKALLPKFILAIFLINFSMVITTIVIDFGQILMFQFVDWMGSFGPTAGGGDDGALSCLTSISRQFVFTYPFDIDQINAEVVGGAFFAAIFVFALMFIYLILAGFLLIRLVMLGLLIVLSPFAFMAVILPGTRSHSSKWWGSLFKYVLFGPIFVFFIYLSSEMGQDLMGAPGTPLDEGSYNVLPSDYITDPKQGGSGAIFGIVVYFIKGGIVMGMLLASVFMTKSMGLIGSSALVGGTAGIGLMGSKVFRGARYGAGKAKAGIGYAGRKAGVDTGSLKQRAYGAVGKAAGSDTAKKWVPDSIRKRIGGDVVISEAGKKAEDRKAISEEKSKYKELTGEQALLAAKGVEAKTLVGKPGEDNKTKIAALIERAIEDGVDVTGKENSKLVSIAKSKNINADEIAKHDPRAAEALGGKKANEYFEKHAEDGSWKKYKGHVWDKDYGSIQKEVNNDKLLRDHFKTAGKETQDHMKKGAGNNLTSTISKYMDSRGNLVGPHAKEEIKKARESQTVVTGDIEAAYGERGYNKETGEYELTGERDDDGEIKIDTSALKGSVDKLSENFKNFNTDSKKLFGKHAKGVSGLDLKGQSQGDIDALIEGLRLNSQAVRQEAGSMTILNQRIRTLSAKEPGLAKEFGIGNKEGEKKGKEKEKENKWDKGAGYA